MAITAAGVAYQAAWKVKDGEVFVLFKNTVLYMMYEFVFGKIGV